MTGSAFRVFSRYRQLLRFEVQPEALERLAKLVCQGPLTLVYAEKNEEHNNAVVIRERRRALM